MPPAVATPEPPHDRPGGLTRLAAAALLLLHAGLLAWGAYRHSPTCDELAHLAAGLHHWQSGRFELYCVNPPLVRMVAALPALLGGADTDWSHADVAPAARPEFRAGFDLTQANGLRIFWLLTIARWACIPFSLLAGWVCYRWATELHGGLAGLLALSLWCFSPDVLGHGQLITPDVGATALCLSAAYLFWRWLRAPTLARAAAAGLVLGLAQLAKLTSLILLPLWPVLGALWLWTSRPPARTPWPALAGKLTLLLLLALYVLNAGYGFEGTFQPLGSARFDSKLFRDPAAGPPAFSPGNRFTGTCLGAVPVPLPRPYLRGIDVQRLDFEGGKISYLRGEFRAKGWWYYYLYAMSVKIPLGTLLLALLALALTLRGGRASAGRQNELLLLLPPAAFLAAVSSQTGFNHHLRYALPAFPFLFVFVSRIASPAVVRLKGVAALTLLLFAWSVASSLSVYPHSLSYFNEAAGGPPGGPAHLLDSNVDWGQDLFYLADWLRDHPDARPLRVAYFGVIDPRLVDPNFLDVPDRLTPGFYAISVNRLYGYALGGNRTSGVDRYGCFRQVPPLARAGYSIYIYRLPPEAAASPPPEP